MQWTSDKIKNFFRHYESQNGMEDNYFGKQRGRSLLAFLSRRIPLKGRALDIGCGPGYFLEYLLRRGIECMGADLSESALKRVESKYSSDPFFKGAFLIGDNFRLPVEDGAVDLVFLIEAVEHVLPDQLPLLFSEAARVMKQGAYFVITTRDREDLASGMISCPDCSASFHYTQHLRSFDKRSLAELLEGHGFKPLFCSSALILPELKDWISAGRKSRGWSYLCPECGKVIPNTVKKKRFSPFQMARNAFHLVCVCRKAA